MFSLSLLKLNTEIGLHNLIPLTTHPPQGSFLPVLGMVQGSLKQINGSNSSPHPLVYIKPITSGERGPVFLAISRYSRRLRFGMNDDRPISNYSITSQLALANATQYQLGPTHTDVILSHRRDTMYHTMPHSVQLGNFSPA